MRRLAQIVLASLLLASCDSGSDVFSLDVTVEDAAGRPVAGQPVALVFGSFGSGAALDPPAQRPAVLDVSPVFPTPWAQAARFVVSVDAPATARADLVDIEGTVVQTPFDGALGAGQTNFVISGESASGAALPAGVYQVRVTAGTQVMTRTTLRTDAVGSRDVGRILGRTAVDGTLTTTDRTVAPSLFETEPIQFYDEVGNSIGSFSFARSVRIVALGDGSVIGTTTATLRDGRNRVRVRLAAP